MMRSKFSKLEKYPYPQKYVTEENRPDDPARIRTVFLDKTDLPVSHRDFGDDIKAKLKEARYLLVVCSANTIKSDYVRQEIDYFLETHDNDKDRILPVYVDNVCVGIHDALNEIVATRNCPIYMQENGDAGKESRRMCFFHILEFLLKVDFSLLYNRYLEYKKRRIRRRFTFLTVVSAVIILLLSMLLLAQQEKYKVEQAKYQFECGIFPYSLVVGYVDNFLKPMLDVLTKTEDAHVIILLPYTYAEYEEGQRIQKFTGIVKGYDGLKLDSISKVVIRPEGFKRDLSINKASFANSAASIYVDDARTVSAIQYVVDYKINSLALPEKSRDELVLMYTDKFMDDVWDYMPDAYRHRLHFVCVQEELFHVLNRLVIGEDDYD